MNNKALVVIDVQNDYFPNGMYPLWNTESTLINIKKAIEIANKKNMKVILIKHVSDPSQGPAPFFNLNTTGIEIHEEILKTAQNAVVVDKSYVDSFKETDLKKVLDENNIKEMIVCGMMTQACVTFASISDKASSYAVKVIPECCTTADELIHNVALGALSDKVEMISLNDI